MSTKTIRFLFRTISISGAFIIAIICIVNRIPDSDIIKIFAVYFALIIVVWFMINLDSIIKRSTKLNSIMPLLYTEPELYLKELDKLLGNTKSSAYKVYYYNNSAVAYYEMGDYAKAKETLLKIDYKSLVGINKETYLVNLALFCIHLGEDDEALLIWEEHKNEIQHFQKDLSMSSYANVIYIFSLIKSGQIQEAKDALSAAKEKWPSKRDMKEFDFLEGLLAEPF